jgi:Fic family protein
VRGTLIDRVWEWDGENPIPNPRYRKSCRYQAFRPDPLLELPSLEPEVAGAVSAAEDAIRRLNDVAQPGLQPLARLLLRSESIASSKVEGIQMDARSLARAEAKSDLGNTVGSEAAEILANIDAMQLAVGEASEASELTIEHLIETHRALMERAVAGGRIAGKVRDRQNWIGGNDYNPCGASFVPPPPEDVGQLLDDLVRFAGDETLPPVVQAAIAHAQFETIHPFEDGNGRTGRALIQILLRRRSLAPEYVPPISVVLAADKQSYMEGLVAFREGREGEWLRTFADAAGRAANLASVYLVEVQRLQDRWREQLASSKPRSDAAAWRVIDVLPAHPVISVPVAVAATGRAKAAVQQAFERLVEVEVLIPLSSGSRNRQYEANGLLDLAADFEDIPAR